MSSIFLYAFRGGGGGSEKVCVLYARENVDNYGWPLMNISSGLVCVSQVRGPKLRWQQVRCSNLLGVNTGANLWRRERVVLAQLRAGAHSKILGAYRHRIGVAANPHVRDTGGPSHWQLGLRDVLLSAHLFYHISSASGCSEQQGAILSQPMSSSSSYWIGSWLKYRMQAIAWNYNKKSSKLNFIYNQYSPIKCLKWQ